jgi:hypothetical protein
MTRWKVPQKCDAMHSEGEMRRRIPLSEIRAELYQTISAKLFCIKESRIDNDNEGPNVMECLGSDEVLEGVL